ncbi:calcium:proton antiporter [Microbacterium sp. CFBP9034]|uniref:calcium:proton antiporter n=1 Tax=Microbacterium sp. CFBP9034 TaxID=3096540 RepID=UPI002A6A51DF|nr:calcium:proton antiporter [Microbacterium sp. CFBP9034]MDY0910701.1 calcium:proton antiporter [Microbacterium sp. CFBP9034]
MARTVKDRVSAAAPAAGRGDWRSLVSRSTVVTLAVGWSATIFFLTIGHEWVAHPPNAGVAVACFVLILAAIMVAAFGVVRHAEHLAEKVGEPFGTLILTLTVVVIEVVLIASIMLGPGGSATIGRDSLFAVMMIIVNGVLGLTILLGAIRFGPQRYNMEGASIYLAMIAALSLCTLVLPSFLASTDDGSLVPLQSIGLAVLSAALYAFFLYMQTGTDRALYLQPLPELALVARTPAPATRDKVSARELTLRTVLLIATVLPIILLAHDLGILVDLGIGLTGAPVALGGVIIAIIVFTPEAITAVRAALADQNQRALNLGLGAFVSTVGLTIPAILVIGLVTGQPVILGESPANMVLICITLVMTLITYFAPRTTAVHGAVHLMLFGVYAILLFAP